MSKHIRYVNLDFDVIERRYEGNNQILLELITSDTEHNKSKGMQPGISRGPATLYYPTYKFEKRQTIIQDNDTWKGIFPLLKGGDKIKEVKGTAVCISSKSASSMGKFLSIVEVLDVE